MVYSKQLRNKSNTTNSFYQPHLLSLEQDFCKIPTIYCWAKSLLWLKSEYTNSHWRIWGSLGHLSSSFYLGPIVGKNQQNVICKIMRKETAEAKKGTWKGRGRCIPGQRHKEEAKPGSTPTFQGKGGRSMYIKSFSQLTNPGSKQEGEDSLGGKRRIGQGEASFEASCQFQTDSCTSLLSAPRGSFSSPEDTFLLLLTQKVFLNTFSSFYGLLQMAKPS